MKITLLVAALAGLVAAAPIRVAVISTSGVNRKIEDPFLALRFGHAAAGAAAAVPNGRGGDSWAPAAAASPGRRPLHMGCGGLRSKMNQIGDKWREALGMKPIQREGEQHAPHHMHMIVEKVHIMPYPNNLVDLGGAPHPTMRGHPKHDQFLYRLHRALNQLGPWEGRAVSFVMGCGIGVLLRMFFVLFVLLVRSRRSSSTVELPTTPVQPQEVIFIAPPEYFVDEKVPGYSTVQEEKVEENQTEVEPVSPAAN